MKKINLAITGSNGFLGSSFIKKYKKKYNIYIIKGNINNISNIKKECNKIKHINFFLHFAGIGRGISSNSKKIFSTNFLAVKNIIKKVKFDHFIFSSTSHVYKSSKNLLNEKSQLKPKNIYGKSKLNAEKYIINNLKNYTILRIFNIYGKNQRKGFIFKDIEENVKLEKKLTLRNDIRDFIHVDEVVRSIHFVIKKKINGIFNISNSKPVSFKKLSKIIEKKLKKKNNINFISSKSKIIGSNKKIKKLGFKFKKKYENINY